MFETADHPEKIRNVALVGHSGAGKTTLVEALLAATGTIARAGKVTDGTTVSDSDLVEVAEQRSVNLSVCPMRWDGVTANLLDTPGYPDFTGELRAGLRAADGALFVVAACEDIDPITVSLWRECAAVDLPRAVVITRLDAPQASFEATVAACQQAFGGVDGKGVLPLYLPVENATDTVPTALIALLSRTSSDYADGFPPTERDLAEHTDAIELARSELIEAIIENSEDETLLERYLGGEEIGLDILIDDLETSVAGARFHPVLPVCSATGVGLAELLEVLSGGFPSPAELDPPAVLHLDGSPAESVRCDARGPLVGEVVRTSVDPYLGRSRPSGSSPAPCSPRRPRTSPATAAPSAAIPTTMWTSASGRSSPRWAPRCARSTRGRR